MSTGLAIGDSVTTLGDGRGVVESHITFYRRADGTLSSPAVFVRWPEGDGLWFTVDELEDTP